MDLSDQASVRSVKAGPSQWEIGECHCSGVQSVIVGSSVVSVGDQWVTLIWCSVSSPEIQCCRWEISECRRSTVQ